MAANSWTMYEVALARFLDGSYDADGDTFKVALFSSASDAATVTAGTNDDLADLTNEVSGNGYAQQTLTTTWTPSGGGATMTFDFTNTVQFTASGGSIVARFAVIFDDTHASNGLVAFTTLDNTPADVTIADGGTLNLTTPSGGVFQLAVAA